MTNEVLYKCSWICDGKVNAGMERKPSLSHMEVFLEVGGFIYNGHVRRLGCREGRKLARGPLLTRDCPFLPFPQPRSWLCKKDQHW